MLQKIRHMGNEAKYSVISLLSLIAVLSLHLVHYLSAPLLIGAASEMHKHHHSTAVSSTTLMSLLMLALFAINLISMYFALRQLVLAWKKRGSGTHHTYLCSTVSLGVLCIGIYTTVAF